MSLPLRISLASFLYRTAVKPFHFICIYIVPRFFSLLFQINPLYFYFVVLSFGCFLLLLCLLIDCVWSLIFIVTWYWLNAILGNHAAFNFSPERRKWIYIWKKKAHDSVTIQHTRMHTILDFMHIGHSSWANVCIEFP